MRIAIGCDHAGYDLKKFIMERLGGRVSFVDVGTYSKESTDYPDYAVKVAELVSKGDVEAGILICGTGIGMSITANKFPGVYAALVYSRESAVLARRHNNANVICLGGRTMPFEDVVEWVDAWLSESFEGGRHLRRINKIRSIEERLCGH